MKITSFIVFVAAIGAGGWSWKKLNTARSDVADDKVVLADITSPDPEAVKRGEYVMRTADCAACHTADKGVFAGAYRISTPFGDLLSSNITPDRESGIGKMTARDFFNAVRQGQGSKGLLYPAMPFTAYAKLTDQDMQDLWAYMATVKPVANKVDENAGMPFPFNVRLVMAGWDVLFFDNSGFSAENHLSALESRGKYLVDAGGHCSACHSPRNSLGAEIDSAYLQGGRLGDWYAPDLTSSPHAGLGARSAAEITEYLKTGEAGPVATGPMAEAIEHSLQYMTDEDLQAIATYLKSLPAATDEKPPMIAATTPAMQRGALRYEVNCAACHGVAGEGMGGMTAAFAGNHTLQSDDATNLIHVMLVGGRAASTHAKITGAGMPSFAWKMDDRQIAETLDYIRNSWGNSAAPVEAAEVGRLRESLRAQSPLPQH
ncbi:cytochrome c [Arboricoccus pini]|nr:cytochrome c [Arboricoccus pini]